MKFRDNIEFFVGELGMDAPELIIDFARMDWKNDDDRAHFVAVLKGVA